MNPIAFCYVLLRLVDPRSGNGITGSWRGVQFGFADCVKYAVEWSEAVRSGHVSECPKTALSCRYVWQKRCFRIGCGRTPNRHGSDRRSPNEQNRTDSAILRTTINYSLKPMYYENRMYGRARMKSARGTAENAVGRIASGRAEIPPSSARPLNGRTGGMPGARHYQTHSAELPRQAAAGLYERRRKVPLQRE